MKSIIGLVFLILCRSLAAGENFTGNEDIVHKAEASRADLWRYWFSEEMKTWSKPCSITARRARFASGSTSFKFDRGEVFGWKMNVAGSSESEILETVVPHEVQHTIFATKFRRRLPRWLDEGSAIFVESESEHLRVRTRLRQNIRLQRFTRFRDLFSRSGDYPSDSTELANLYDEGFAIVEFLVNHHKGGRQRFVKFVGDVRVDEDGSSTVRALRKHYGYKSADDFQNAWWDHWRARFGLSCDHHSCKAPHNAIFFDGLHSPIFAHVQTGPAPAGCELVMYSGPTCGPCNAWKRDEKAAVVAAGVPVRIVENNAEARRLGITSYPTFVVIHRSRIIARTSGYIRSTKKNTAAKLVEFFKSNRPPECLPATDPVENFAELAEFRETLTTIETRLEAVENRPTDAADVSGLEKRVGLLETISIPVRIETASGVVIREKNYQLKRDGDGRLVFTPIVLKFDERILRGEAPR